MKLEPSIKLTFIGSGSAFTKENYQSNMLIEVEDDIGIHRLLIDCGTTAGPALHNIGLSFYEIDAIYVSHGHADHIGGLEEAGFTTFFNPECPKPSLYIHEKLVGPLWENSLKLGMASLQLKQANLSTYFDVNAIKANSSFIFYGVEFSLVQTIHIMDGNEVMPSYGLIFKTADGTKVFITTDTQFCPHQIQDFYKDSDIIFQDCETLYLFDGTAIRSGVHAHLEDLKTLDEKIRKKMWLYHYQDTFFAHVADPLLVNEKNFAGFVGNPQREKEFITFEWKGIDI